MPSVLKSYPGIKVVAIANGTWYPATTQQAFSSLFALTRTVNGASAK